MIKVILIEYLQLLILSSAIVWETNNDKKGDLNKKQDVVSRGIIMVVSALFVWFIFQKSLILSILMAIALHFFFFDYLVSYALWKNGVIHNMVHWFSYLGKSSWMDNIPFWRKAGPWGRFFIRLGVLITVAIPYFLFEHSILKPLLPL